MKKKGGIMKKQYYFNNEANALEEGEVEVKIEIYSNGKLDEEKKQEIYDYLQAIAKDFSRI